MARIDLRDLDEQTVKKLDEQCAKYGIKSRRTYIKLLINLDMLTGMVGDYVKKKKRNGDELEDE